MHYYLTRGDEKNIEKSILNPINIENEKDTYGWAITRGSGKNKKKNARYAKEMSKGDKIIIWPKGDSKNIYVGTIIKTKIGIDIPKKIWGEETDLKYDCAIFIKDIEEITIKKKDLIKALGYKGAPQGIGELKGEKVEAIKKILNYEKKKFTNNSNRSLDIEKNLMDTYWSESLTTKKCCWNNILQKRNNKNRDKNKNTKKSKSISTNIYITPKDMKIIGLTGEKKANEFINDNKYEILKKLEIKYRDTDTIIINWFNNGIPIEEYCEKEKDKSVGKGYDIEMSINDKKIKFEVKSSYNGEVNEINLTRTEIDEMLRSISMDDEFYYIMLVSDLKNNPKITIIKNFFIKEMEEYLDMASKHYMYISRIKPKYIV